MRGFAAFAATFLAAFFATFADFLDVLPAIALRMIDSSIIDQARRNGKTSDGTDLLRRAPSSRRPLLAKISSPHVGEVREGEAGGAGMLS